MKRSLPPFLFALSAAFGALLPAQTNIQVGENGTSAFLPNGAGNTIWSTQNQVSAILGSGFGSGTYPVFTNNPMSRLLFYYRTEADNTNRLFSFVDTPVVNFSGNTATVTYNNAGPGVAGTARFNAVFTFTLNSTGAGNAFLTTSLTVTASAANTQARTFNFFQLLDLDVSGNGADDNFNVNSSTAGSTVVRATDGTSNFIEVTANGISRYEVSTRANLYNNRIGNFGAGSGSANFNQLAGTIEPAQSGDQALGLQWTALLNPGQSISWTSTVGFNTTIPEPSTYALCLSGLAGGALWLRRRRQA
ncbi:MAG: PEP-CTERM sorting domain-containing protein [Verrucomicrobia bacterium]|nr:PEP-CTERM sorting domain-containing protein [Verrucomicrobiota bacterium]